MAALVEKYVRPLPASEQSGKVYALLNFSQQGYCPFLLADGLCRIHSVFGPQPLSNVCALYPRVFNKYEDTVEMTAALSCPEVARLCLSAALPEQSFTDIYVDQIVREEQPVLSRVLAAADSDTYAGHFLAVRRALLELAAMQEYALESRQYFLANLSHRLSRNYYRHCGDATEFVQNELARISDAHTLDNLDEFLTNYTSAEPIAIIIIQAVIQMRIQQAPEEKLTKLMQAQLLQYRQSIRYQDELDVFGDNIAPVPLWQAYQEKWHAFNPRFGVYLEKYLINYLINCLQREWFVTMPEPFCYVQMLMVRMAILRFLIVSDAQIQELLAQVQAQKDTISQEQQRQFQERVVSIVYLFARSIDHNLTFLQILFEALREQQMLSYEYSLPLIKF